MAHGGRTGTPLDKVDLLAPMTFYREASPALQARLAAGAQHVSLAAGQRLFHEGDISTNVAVVGAGSLRVFRIGSTGREITLYHVRTAQATLASMLSALLGIPLLATAEAEVATEVVLVPSSVLEDAIETGEPMRTFIFETMARALIEVTAVLEDVAFRPMEGRIATFLLEHFALSDVISMRHEDIASELGTAREVVSRMLESYERRGAIRLSRGHIEQRDVDVLREIGRRPPRTPRADAPHGPERDDGH